MKKVLIGLAVLVAGVAVVAGAIIGLVFWLSGGAVEASDEFLTLIGQEKIEEAYQKTATAFRSQQDAATFGATVRGIGLTRYQSASWTNRQIENNRATLEGSVTTSDGGTIPLTISLVSEGDTWKVLGLTAPLGGAAIAGAEKGTTIPAAPDDAVVRQLVNGTMRSFSQALQRNDFAPFYQTISNRWKGQITADGLGRAFQPLIDQKTDLAAVQSLDPTFSAPPALNSDGLLVATGSYPITPDEVEFELTYIYEAPAWKLFGIHVNPESSRESAATTAPEEGSAAEKIPPAAGDAGGAAYTVAENPELTGRLGRILVAFPAGTNPSSTRIEVRPAGGKESSASSYGKITADLLPGTYQVVISDVVVPGVEVRSRHDTTIAVGVLRVAAGSSTRIQVFRGQQAVASGYGKAQFGLPAGAYELEISGRREPITIEAGGTIDF